VLVMDSGESCLVMLCNVGSCVLMLCNGGSCVLVLCSAGNCVLVLWSARWCAHGMCSGGGSVLLLCNGVRSVLLLCSGWGLSTCVQVLHAQVSGRPPAVPECSATLNPSFVSSERQRASASWTRSRPWLQRGAPAKARRLRGAFAPRGRSLGCSNSEQTSTT
jgi:hypothetical protein